MPADVPCPLTAGVDGGVSRCTERRGGPTAACVKAGGATHSSKWFCAGPAMQFARPTMAPPVEEQGVEPPPRRKSRAKAPASTHTYEMGWELMLAKHRLTPRALSEGERVACNACQLAIGRDRKAAAAAAAATCVGRSFRWQVVYACALRNDSL